MRKTNQSAIGTSFHDSVIMATVSQLKAALGEPCYDANDGRDKINYEWEMETDSGHVFTVYDWKQYTPLDDDEVIEWHIGGKDRSVTEEARIELSQAIRNLKKKA